MSAGVRGDVRVEFDFFVVVNNAVLASSGAMPDGPSVLLAEGGHKKWQ